MEIEFHGANCIKIANKKTSLVVDDNLAVLGGKPVATTKDIIVNTGQAPGLEGARFSIDQPGEYEVADVSVQGIAARSHLDEEKAESATMYRIIMDGVRIAVTGHIHPDLSDRQLEELGTIDILFVPVGGNGYTLDGIGAQKVIKEIEPKIVVPVHFDDSKLKFEVPQTPLDDALRALAMETSETVDSIKLKTLELGEGATRLVVMNRA